MLYFENTLLDPTKGSSNPRGGLLDLFAYPRVWVYRP